MNPAEFRSLESSEAALWWFRGMKKILFGLLDGLLPAGGGTLVLEAGSGTGYMSGQLLGRFGWRMVPAEIAWQGLSLTPRRDGLMPVQADIRSCPFAAGVFDAVLSLDVIIHLTRGQESLPLAEFARVLKPGGLLVLRVSALDVLRSRHSEFCHERQRFTRRRLRQIVETCGLRVHRCSYANSLLLPVALARFRLWEPLMNSPVASGTRPLPRWLDWLLYQPLALESALLGRGWDLPLGQSLILVAAKAAKPE
jgi:SAM-dependent methyltransferase